jgi:NAD(P)-dependent dehydrogenase (short-subunit alcohol dehydrogenase family)
MEGKSIVSARWFDLTGRVALVTGAGANGGNGHAIALGLAACGADVLVSDIDDPGVERTVAEIRDLGRRAEGCHCDVGEAEQIEAMFARHDAAFGQIDILVNNVGIGHRSRPEELALEDWRRVVRVNMEGTFLCSMAAGRRMIARGQGGSIINISSIAGSSALGRGNFVYSAAKGGINQFTRELAVEWSIHNIRVNAILPAQTMTPALRAIFERSQLDGQRTRERMLVGIPLGRFGEPEDMAKAAVFLASDAAAFITGHLLPVDGGNMAMNAGGSRVWPTE